MVGVTPAGSRRGLTTVRRTAAALLLVCAGFLVIDALAPVSARAETVPVPLGTAEDYAVLAGTTITNTGLSVVTGDMGVAPGTARTGFPPGEHNGTFHSNDASAVQAQIDLASAYDNAVARTTTDVIATELGGTTQTTGVYGSASGTFEITGTVTLNAAGDPNAVFIFKTASTVVTAANSTVVLAGGARACNVFWQVGSSATLGADSTFRGTMLTFTSITVGARVDIDGRVLARGGAVTLDADTITPPCGELSITAPASASLGQATPGTEIGGTLGPVTVVDRRGLTDAGWVATVDATDFVTIGTPVRTIARANAFYFSGVGTEGGIGVFEPGQPERADAVAMNAARIVTYSLTEGVGITRVTWNPYLFVQVPLSAVAGTYTGTVTFSVA